MPVNVTNPFEQLINDVLNKDKKSLRSIKTLPRLSENQISLLEKTITDLPDNSSALFFLGKMNHIGLGKPVDFKKAIYFYELAIKKGNKYAMNNRACMHKTGEGGPINLPAAVNLLELAIEKGNSNSMDMRAVMHEDGLEGPVNLSEAIRLFELAIAKGNYGAMVNRGCMHYRGVGGPKDYNAAAKLYRQAWNKPNMTTQEIARKNIASILNDSNFNNTSNTFEASYHISIIYNNYSWQKNPVIFLSFLAQDDLLTEKEQLAILAECITSLPDIDKIKDKPSIDLIGKYHFQTITNLLGVQWNLKANVTKRAMLLKKAIECLDNIPKVSIKYREACHAIATHSYQYTLENIGNEASAFEIAQPYFHEGAQLGDDLCQTHYLQLLQNFLRPKLDALSEEDQLKRIGILEAEYTKIFDLLPQSPHSLPMRL